MAGSRPNDSNNRPANRVQVMSKTFVATVSRWVVLCLPCPKEYKVNWARGRAEALDGTNTGITANLAKVADGAALSSNTDVSGTLGFGSVSGVGQANKTRDFALLTTGQNVPTENILNGNSAPSPAGVVTPGQALILEFSVAPAASLGPVEVTWEISEMTE